MLREASVSLEVLRTPSDNFGRSPESCADKWSLHRLISCSMKLLFWNFYEKKKIFYSCCDRPFRPWNSRKRLHS
jgi:hypothetical protein